MFNYTRQTDLAIFVTAKSEKNGTNDVEGDFLRVGMACSGRQSNMLRLRKIKASPIPQPGIIQLANLAIFTREASGLFGFDSFDVLT